MDVSLRIKVINNGVEAEISIGDQDSSLSGLFWGSGVKYTNFNIELSDILTEDEIRLLKFKHNNKVELEARTQIINAQQLKLLVDKIYKKTYYPSMKVLRNDIVQLSKNMDTIQKDDFDKKIYSTIFSYTYFYNTLIRFKAIVDLAAEQNAQIQIFEDYY